MLNACRPPPLIDSCIQPAHPWPAHSSLCLCLYSQCLACDHRSPAALPIADSAPSSDPWLSPPQQRMNTVCIGRTSKAIRMIVWLDLERSKEWQGLAKGQQQVTTSQLCLRLRVSLRRRRCRCRRRRRRLCSISRVPLRQWFVAVPRGEHAQVVGGALFCDLPRTQRLRQAVFVPAGMQAGWPWGVGLGLLGKGLRLLRRTLHAEIANRFGCACGMGGAPTNGGPSGEAGQRGLLHMLCSNQRLSGLHHPPLQRVVAVVFQLLALLLHEVAVGVAPPLSQVLCSCGDGGREVDGD